MCNGITGTVLTQSFGENWSTVRRVISFLVLGVYFTEKICKKDAMKLNMETLTPSSCHTNIRASA